MSRIDAPHALTFFDRDADFAVVDRRLPHWSQPGTVAFLTWRAWDSIPREVAGTWLRERAGWLARHDIDPTGTAWRERLATLPRAAQHEFHRAFSDRWQGWLDESHGACALREPELARIVADSLHYFDRDRYLLTDFVVMPNHVHVLASFPDDRAMLAQCESWKHFTAVQLNRRLGRTGRFWQADGFDHLVRSDVQFEALRSYIADNPRRAGLAEGSFVRYSTALDGAAQG